MFNKIFSIAILLFTFSNSFALEATNKLTCFIAKTSDVDSEIIYYFTKNLEEYADVSLVVNSDFTELRPLSEELPVSFSEGEHVILMANDHDLEVSITVITAKTQTITEETGRIDYSSILSASSSNEVTLVMNNIVISCEKDAPTE